MTRRLALAAIVAAAAAVPFGGSASAVCENVAVRTTASAGYCDEQDYWVWCAGASVGGVAGAGACQYENRTGLFVGCWTYQGLHCN